MLQPALFMLLVAVILLVAAAVERDNDNK